MKLFTKSHVSHKQLALHIEDRNNSHMLETNISSPIFFASKGLHPVHQLSPLFCRPTEFCDVHGSIKIGWSSICYFGTN